MTKFNLREKGWAAVLEGQRCWMGSGAGWAAVLEGQRNCPSQEAAVRMEAWGNYQGDGSLGKLLGEWKPGDRYLEWER